MKVLTVSHHQPFYGGAEYLLYYLCRFLDKQGIENTLIAPRIAPELGQALIDAGSTTRIKESGGANTLMQIGQLTDAVRLFGQDADVINVHNFPATLSVTGVKKPTVWMCNEPPEIFLDSIKENTLKRMARRLLIKSNKVFAEKQCTEAVVADIPNAERYQALYGYYPVIIPYGVDSGYWGELKRQEASKERDFMILQVGTVTPLKNQIATVRAMAEVVKAIPHATLWLAGKYDPKDAYAKEIQKEIVRNNLAGSVIIHGQLTRNELRNIYAVAHVVVHPIKPQGGWLTPFEAIAARVPVIVGSEATTVNLIRDRDLGVVTSEGNLAGAIVDAYTHYPEYEDRAERAAEWVRDNLTWEQWAREYYNVMRDAIKDFVIEGVRK